MTTECVPCGTGSFESNTEATVTVNKTPMSQDGNFLMVTYNGEHGQHLVYSPSRILQTYGVANYGHHSNGDVFKVHKDDIALRPELFVITLS